MGRIEQFENATLYLGDCRDVLPTLSAVDAVLADPPYGIPNKFGQALAADGGKRVLQFDWGNADTTATVLEACRLSVRLGQSHFWWGGLHQASGIAAMLIESGMTPKPAAYDGGYS